MRYFFSGRPHRIRTSSRNPYMAKAPSLAPSNSWSGQRDSRIRSANPQLRMLRILARSLANARAFAQPRDPIGFESAHGAHTCKRHHCWCLQIPGAGNGTRTRECQLGKLMPYHLAMPAYVHHTCWCSGKYTVPVFAGQGMAVETATVRSKRTGLSCIHLSKNLWSVGFLGTITIRISKHALARPSRSQRYPP